MTYISISIKGKRVLRHQILKLNIVAVGQKTNKSYKYHMQLSASIIFCETYFILQVLNKVQFHS